MDEREHDDGCRCLGCCAAKFKKPSQPVADSPFIAFHEASERLRQELAAIPPAALDRIEPAEYDEALQRILRAVQAVQRDPSAKSSDAG